mmetsp:Transcript_31078/g.49619  ORF Transcript_31078/g.49619 Transcript_31078/m.49619 type:complete len:111 (-) Transcript_31078:1018-1350(-)
MSCVLYMHENLYNVEALPSMNTAFLSAMEVDTIHVQNLQTFDHLVTQASHPIVALSAADGSTSRCFLTLMEIANLWTSKKMQAMSKMLNEVAADIAAPTTKLALKPNELA